MKRLHRSDLFSWSVFNERLNIDFNGFVWTRPEGNVVFDPVPMSAHDEAHLRQLGGAAWIVLTNSAHVRATPELVKAFGSKVAGPQAEKAAFPIACDRFLSEGDELVPGLRTVELQGSKTPGELAFRLGDDTVLSGDLVRSHRAGKLMLLLDEQGVKDRRAAEASVKRLLAPESIDAVLVGDGFCVYRNARPLIEELVATFGG